MLLLLDNYDSFTYNLFHFLGELGAEIVVHRNDQISVRQALSARPEAIVVSPGPCTPKEAGISVDLIKAAAEKNVPVLGVCLGHQAIGEAFGGDVIRANAPMHGKISEVLHEGDGLYAGVPGRFACTRYHSLVIDRASLPDALSITSETADGIIMGVRHKSLPIHGVQFHPESIASEHGKTLLGNFLKMARG